MPIAAMMGAKKIPIIEAIIPWKKPSPDTETIPNKEHINGKLIAVSNEITIPKIYILYHV